VKCAFALAFALCTLPLSASAQPSTPVVPKDPAALLTGKVGGLTSDQVAARTTATSFAAEEKLHEVRAAAAALDRAVYDFVPKLSGQVSYYRLSKVDGGSLGTLVAAPGAPEGPVSSTQPLVAVPVSFESLRNATTLTTSLTLPLSDYVLRLFQARASAEAQLHGARLSLEATRRKDAYQGRALYYDWVRAELEAAAAAQNLELSQQHLSRLRALADADAASPADVARVEATVASAERVLVQAQNLAQLQRARLAISMHTGDSAAFTIGEDLTQAVAAPPAPRDIAQLTRQAEAQRPELHAAALQAVAYDKQADATRSRALPRLDAIAQSTLANPNQRYFPQKDEFKSSWQVGAQLSFSLSDTLSGATQIDQARAQAAAARSQRSQLVDAVRAEVTDAVLAERTAQASLDSTARRLAAAQTSYQARYERFLVGQATTVELTEAQTELFNAQLEVVQARVSIRVARARIAYVTGS
jgi:outer membrane protein TolC